MIRILTILAAWGLALPAAPAVAQGRIELNQTSIEAAGGFPFVISAPGSYVLTSDLAVATDVGAIAITTLGGVTIDLNGFHIQGSSSCSLGSCAPGAAIGVSGPPFFGFGSNIVVHGGEVSGFSGSCIILGSTARVEGMVVSGCGRNGIFVGKGGSVTGNLVSSTGENGILLDAGSVYAHNSVQFTSLGGAGGSGIRGGSATAGNYCDDGSCSKRGARRYYLTVSLFNGSETSTACAPGFQVARFWQIFDPSSLEYDTVRGRDIGKFSQHRGWAYASLDHCQDWTGVVGDGTQAVLLLDDAAPSVSFDNRPWVFQAEPCSGSAAAVWCIEE